MYQAIAWRDGALRLLDQRQLPHATVYLDYHTPEEVAVAIREMVVRGAPSIGITAAYGMALAAQRAPDAASLQAAAACLRAARPTAVNLFWAVDRMLAAAQPVLDDAAALPTALLAAAHLIADLERANNLAIGQHALPLVPEGAHFIHHCNTGPLATGEIGTALGVIWAAHQAGKRVHVYVDETRPRLQGARLTTWELQRMGIPHTLIVDGAAAHIMRTRRVDLCVVGCDRVAANGDTANKIGTYALALAAHAHGVPFYVVGPTTSIDMALSSGDDIAIEERATEEVTRVGTCSITPEGVQVANIAFDVTPARYITAIITEHGVVYPPFRENLLALAPVV